MVLASGWVLVCSVISAIIYSDSIILNVLKRKCRRNGSRQNGTKNPIDKMGVDKMGVNH